jgi:hypothetical protein
MNEQHRSGTKKSPMNLTTMLVQWIFCAILLQAALWNGNAHGEDAKAPISVPEAKAMVLAFLDSSEIAKESAWIRASKPIIEKREAVVFEDGTIAWGPWNVKPNNGRVQLVADRYFLEGRAARQDGKWRLEDVQVYSIRRRGE